MTVEVSGLEKLEITNNAGKIDQLDVGKYFMITYCTGPDAEPDERFVGRRALLKIEPDHRLIAQFGDIPCRRFHLVDSSWDGKNKKIIVVPKTDWCFSPGLPLPRLYTHPAKASQFVWVDCCVVETISEIPAKCLPDLFRTTMDQPIDKFEIHEDFT